MKASEQMKREAPFAILWIVFCVLHLVDTPIRPGLAFSAAGNRDRCQREIS